ncbi:MAG TPA: GNAT family N-acetyltransferase [Dyadobacter sp.]|jgi:GNAT superfamily N-acetyltransferase|nr:GNAT family N-acetyltransferase [Dyadobacter sp.]
MNIEIKKVEVADILEIRHQVLWPDQPLEFVKVAEDDSGVHFGLFLNAHLVSVISVFADQDRLRFRKFATLQAYQNKGLGSQLLRFVINYARDNRFKGLWCDARSTASDFYTRHGFEKYGEPFFKNDTEYYKMSMTL